MPNEPDVLIAQQERYYRARTDYDNSKADTEVFEKEWRDQEEKLIQRMMDAGVKSVTLADGSRPTLAKSTSAKCNKDNADQVSKWLIDTVGDDADFTVMMLDRWKVIGHVKKQIEEEGMDPLDFPEFLGVSTRPTIRVLGWEKRKSTPSKNPR